MGEKNEVAAPAKQASRGEVEAPAGESFGDIPQFARVHQIEALFLGQRAEAQSPEDLPAGRFRQPVHQRKLGMKLDRKPAVRRRQADSPARHSQTFGDHPCLVADAADVLEDRR